LGEPDEKPSRSADIAEPIDVLIFPGSGITENLRDKARHFGLTIVWELKGDGA
jgi:hypothetical protein